MNMNQQIRDYWEQAPCGVKPQLLNDITKYSREWFERIEQGRYEREPFIHSAAQFTLHHGEKILEIGVGAGTDHLQWARSGAICHGVDLTETAIQITRERFREYGFKSELRRVDAEKLPFPDSSFDLVYSWGVIHHSSHPDLIISEIWRVLRPRGQFIGMMYGRHSVNALNAWVKFALFKLKPWRSFSDVVWNHLESIGTKAYTVRELKTMFSHFSFFSANPILTTSERKSWPAWISQFVPDKYGFFVILRGTK